MKRQCDWAQSGALLLLAMAGVILGQNPAPNAQLNPRFYAQTCPGLQQVSAVVMAKHLQQDISAAASLARMFFHDCFVEGCDGSVLLDSTANATAEKAAVPNLTLRRFDVIEEIKTQIELMCPGVVSCADILALAARDAIVQSGGPSWSVEFGRRDGRVSTDVDASSHLPSSRLAAQPLIDSFASAGLNVRDLVSLSGAHTFGRAHCTQVARRFYGFNSSNGIDPTLDLVYAKRLRQVCPQPLSPSALVLLDPITPNKFDNQYFQGLLVNLGMFSSDSALVLDNRTRIIVEEYARNGASFASNFSLAMIKLGRIGVLTGQKGEIRKKCNVVN